MVGVAEFIYLGTLINKDNCVEKEIQRRILAGNRTYFAAINLFKSRLLSRATKIKLYKTSSVIRSRNMDLDEKRRTSPTNL